MKEFEIIDHSREKKEIRGQVVSPERLAEIYPHDELARFWGFVKRLKADGRREFAVSREQDQYAKDPSLTFFRASDNADGVRPQITFLGRNVAKGSIEISSRFAAETWGYSVLQLNKKEGYGVRKGK